MHRRFRHLWFAIMLIAGSMLGAAGGVLTWLAGSNVPAAIVAGGSVFGGAIALLVAIYRFLSEPPRGGDDSNG
jgi:drug/metabolite transporter (DMT)-like permease